LKKLKFLEQNKYFLKKINFRIFLKLPKQLFLLKKMKKNEKIINSPLRVTFAFKIRKTSQRKSPYNTPSPELQSPKSESKSPFNSVSTKTQRKSISPPRISSLSPATSKRITFAETLKNFIKKKHLLIISEITRSGSTPLSLEKTKALVKSLIIKISEKKRISESFETLIENLKALKTPRFSAYVCLILAKILYKFNDFLESIRFLHIERSIICGFIEISYKSRMYKYMSLCLISLKSYEKARKYALKLLKLALIFQNQNLESYANDLLGKIYFYLNDLKKATEYHEKMLTCHKTQEIRNIGRLLKAKYLEKKNYKNKEASLTSSEEENLDLLDNFQNNRGRQLNTGFTKSFYSHLSNDRGDPKENLQDYAGGNDLEKLKGLKKSVMKILDLVENKKKSTNLKEFYARNANYAKEKLVGLLMIISFALGK